MASLDVLLLPLGSDEIDELPYLNREQLAEAFDMVARVNKGEAIGSSPLADLVNHVHTKNKVPANYFQMTPAQQQRWARRSYRRTARAWWRRARRLNFRRVDRLRPRVKAPLASDRRRQIRESKAFDATTGPPRRADTDPPAPGVGSTGGRQAVGTNSRQKELREFNSIGIFCNPDFSGNGELRPERGRR